MKIFLIRHGESTSDVENRYGGEYDDHLTAKGNKQSKDLAKTLSGKKMEIVLTSPKLRAIETADRVAEAAGCDVEIIEDLRERNRYGILTGMKIAEAKKKHPDQVALLSDFKSTLKGGEPYEHFKYKVLRAFGKIEQSNYRAVGVVTHGGPIKCVLLELFGRKEARDVADCGFFELDYTRGKLDITDESHTWA